MLKGPILCFLAFVIVNATNDAPEVRISQGLLKGSYRKTWQEKTFRAFTGIPYAKPPVGELRFKISVPAEPWQGVLDASKERSLCPQIDIIFDGTKPTGNEDCLYLNVFAPPLTKQQNESLPVMVFIHGGGFVKGSGNRFLNGPDILLDKDVILVTLNYRLGALGFLSTGDEVLPGNNGLKDQSLALKWVKNNIVPFGGNPERITIFGQSAGGSSVHYHMLSPLSKDLFFAVIAHSGVAPATWAFASKNQSVANGKRLAGYLNCPANSSQTMVDCLMKVDAFDIINQGDKFVEWNVDPCIPFKPVVEPNIEGAFLTDLPTEIIKSGNFAQVPFMIGALTDDGTFESAIIYNKTKQVEELDKDFVNLAPLVFQYDEAVPDQKHLTKEIREFYLGDRKIDNSTKTEITDMMTDVCFLQPQNYAALLHAKHPKQSVYYFLFGYKGTVSFGPIYGDPIHNYGTAHSDDLIYLLSADIFKNYKPNEADKEMIEVMTTLWINFAKAGNPTPELNGFIRNKWEPLKNEELKFYYIGNSHYITMMENPYMERTEFWKNHPIYAGTNKLAEV